MKRSWINPDTWSKKSYTVCGVLAIYCYDDDQREIIRRLARTAEHMEFARCEAMLRKDGVVSEDLADRFARAHAACTIVAADICDDVLCESRTREAEAAADAQDRKSRPAEPPREPAEPPRDRGAF